MRDLSKQSKMNTFSLSRKMQLVLIISLIITGAVMGSPSQHRRLVLGSRTSPGRLSDAEQAVVRPNLRRSLERPIPRSPDPRHGAPYPPYNTDSFVHARRPIPPIKPPVHYPSPS